VRLDFAYSIRTVLYVMAAIMAVAAVAALLGLRAGAQQETDATAAPAERTGPQQEEAS
jgi:Flp pilus assembly protein CpaB